MLALGNRKACCWDELDVSEEQLELLGVDSMLHVSGQGLYKAEFDLPVCDGAPPYCGYRSLHGGIRQAERAGNSGPEPEKQQGGFDRACSGGHQCSGAGDCHHPHQPASHLPLFDGTGGLPGPPAPAGAEAGGTPMELLEMENDYELPGAPMDMPEPRPDNYHYGILKAVVTPYQNI